MPKFNVSVPHGSSREDVVGKLQGFAETVRAGSAVELTDVVEEWDDEGNLSFSFKAMGMQIAGRMETSNSEVAVSGDLPFAASMFRGTIETKIRETIQDALQA